MHNLNNYTVLRQKLQSEPVENEGNEAWINKIFSTFPFFVCCHGPACETSFYHQFTVKSNDKLLFFELLRFRVGRKEEYETMVNSD